MLRLFRSAAYHYSATVLRCGMLTRVDGAPRTGGKACDGRLGGGDGLGGGPRAFSGAVSRRAIARGATLVGAGLRDRAAAAGRAQERRTDGAAGGAGRRAATASFHLDLAVGDGAARSGAGAAGRPAGRRRGCGASG